MKSLKQLFHNKDEEQQPTQPQQPLIDLKDLATLEDASEEAIIQAIQKEPRLSERRESLARFIQKMERKPLELIEEKILRRQKFSRILVLITQEIRAREQKQVLAQFKGQKEWNKENIPKLLPNIRFATRDVTLLRKGMLSIDVMNWHTPTTTKIKIGKTEFDLEKIHPSTWQNAMAHKFTPMFFQVRGTAIKNGKPMRPWRHGDESFEESKKIKIVSPVWLAIMVV